MRNMLKTKLENMVVKYKREEKKVERDICQHKFDLLDREKNSILKRLKEDERGAKPVATEEQHQRYARK